MLRRNECGTNEFYEFLKLLKQPNDKRNANAVEISEEMFVRAVKGSKKWGSSSVFSGRTHAVYEFSILSERMLSVLVMVCNMMLTQKH